MIDIFNLVCTRLLIVVGCLSGPKNWSRRNHVLRRFSRLFGWVLGFKCSKIQRWIHLSQLLDHALDLLVPNDSDAEVQRFLDQLGMERITFEEGFVLRYEPNLGA